MDISQSKITTWRLCRKQYYYKYIMKLEKKFKPYPLLRGSLIHEMLEEHYLGNDPWIKYDSFLQDNEKTLRLNPEEYKTMPRDTQLLMGGYFDFYEDEDINPIKVEYEFRSKLVKNIYLVGKMDVVARSQKLNWMVEHKCHNIIPTGSVVPFQNIQNALYIDVYNKENKKKIDGTLWNYLWGKSPTRPQLLKNGTMSKRSIQITWSMYRKSLREAKLNPKDYMDMKMQLKGNENLFYQRKFVPLNKTLTESIVEDTKTTALEIQKYAGKDQTRNLGRHCDYCEFKYLCLAQLKGLDDNYIIKADFKIKEKKK